MIISINENTVTTQVWDQIVHNRTFTLITELLEYIMIDVKLYKDSTIVLRGDFFKNSDHEVTIHKDKKNILGFTAINSEAGTIVENKVVQELDVLNELICELAIKFKTIPSVIDIEKGASIVYDSKFIKVYKKGEFTYAERLGKNSVAFVLYDSNRANCYGVIHESKPPIDKFLTTAFGGSLDDNAKTLKDIVKAEVLEEAGYKVKKKHIHKLGNVLVSTQMNQFCHLYMVDITKSKHVGATTTDPTELLAEVKWLKWSSIIKLQDWKAQTIIIRALEKAIV